MGLEVNRIECRVCKRKGMTVSDSLSCERIQCPIFNWHLEDQITYYNKEKGILMNFAELLSNRWVVAGVAFVAGALIF